jgi:UDPglucose 6-dehydrogenase
LAGGSVEGLIVAVWGLRFTPPTDQIRDSPSLQIVRRLRERGAIVQAYDPAVEDFTDSRLEGIELCSDPYAACAGAEVLALLTEWDEFKWLDFDKVAEAMASPRVMDARNLVDRAALVRRGFQFEGIGRA